MAQSARQAAFAAVHHHVLSEHMWGLLPCRPRIRVSHHGPIFLHVENNLSWSSAQTGARVRCGNNLQWYILWVRVSSRFVGVPIDDHIHFCIFSIAASDWLFSKVDESLTPFGLNVVHPDNHLWVFFIKKTTLLQVLFEDRAIRNSFCFRWCDLILPQPLVRTHFPKLRMAYPKRPKCPRPQITVSQCASGTWANQLFFQYHPTVGV